MRKCTRRAIDRLTDDIQINGVAFNWLRWDLTIVAAGITLLHPLDLQRPLVSRPVVSRLEAEVSRVSVSADRQNVQIPMPNRGEKHSEYCNWRLQSKNGLTWSMKPGPRNDESLIAKMSQNIQFFASYQ